MAASPDRRWLALALISAVQFMVVLDIAIVNVALPSIKVDLGFSQENLQWVISAYALAFGGFLLLGGRAADLLGRRRMFVAGLVLFAAGSIVAGFAWSEASLIGARSLQGLGAAVISPAALSILMTTFREGRERNIALGVWGAVGMFGAPMLDTALTRPTDARAYASRRRVRLSDMDAAGRVRLDAVARFLQDAAIDDVEETGWGIPEHIWVIRKIRVDVVAPLLRDRARRDRDLVQRRRRDRGGSPLVGSGRCGRAGRDRQRLDPPRPRSAAGQDRRLRAVRPSAAGRPVSTKLELPDPPADAVRVPWALRSTDLDANGHVNNAVYWQAVEDWCAREGMDPVLTASSRARLPRPDRPRRPRRAGVASSTGRRTAVSPSWSPTGSRRLPRSGRSSSSRSPAASTGRRCCRSSAPR